MSRSISPVTTSPNLASAACVEGFGYKNFNEVCQFNCKSVTRSYPPKEISICSPNIPFRYNYCPISACVCTKKGVALTQPATINKNGYPEAGLGSSYIGLCSFACNYNFCPSNACSYSQSPLVEPTVFPFLPLTCTGSTGSGAWKSICEATCKYGYCPRQKCTCTSTGNLLLPPPLNESIFARPLDGGDDGGICKFACQIKQGCDSNVCGVETGIPGGILIELPVQGNVTVEYKVEFHDCNTAQQNFFYHALEEKDKITGSGPVYYTDFHHAAAVDFFG